MKVARVWPVESDTDDSSDPTNSDYGDINELSSQDSFSHSDSSGDSELSVFKTADEMCLNKWAHALHSVLKSKNPFLA